MTNTTDFFVQTLFTQLTSDCSSARSRIRSAQTMRAVKYAADVHPDPVIRAYPQTRNEVRRVHEAAEIRLSELLDQQLQKLAVCASSDKIRAKYVGLVRNDWCFLRGQYSRIYLRADREFHRILRARANPSASTASAAHDEEPYDEEPGSAPAP